MKRRALLQAAGLGLVGLQLGLLAGCGREAADALATPVADPAAGDALRRLAGDLKGIEFVGPACADQGLSPQPLPTLLERLRSTGEPDLGRALAALTEADFTTARVFDIDGWQIAESECLLLAAAAGLQGLQSARRTRPGDLVFEDFTEIERWGPQETIAGRIFNPVKGERGGLWVRVAESVPGSTRLVFDGVELATHFETGVVTASLEPDHTREVIAEPGMYELLLVDTATQRAQRVGYLTVRRRPPMAKLEDGSTSEVFCQVEDWGPTDANRGQAFNEQPDGSAAFWVRMACAPRGARLALNRRSLPTTVQSGLVTARVPHYAELEPGDHRLLIVDPRSGEELRIGTFRVN